MKINSVNATPVINLSNKPSTVVTENVSESSPAAASPSILESAKTPKIKSVEKSDGQSTAENEKDQELMTKSIEQANQALSGYDKKIERSVHEVTKAVIYTIRDTKTNEVISEYPTRKIQDMIAKMWELAGLVVDKRV